MSSYPTDDSVQPTTPIFDETVTATAVHPTDDDETGSGSKTDQAKDQAKQTAAQAKDTAKETAGVAKEQAGQVAGAAKDAAGQVAGTTKEQASRVAKDALGQARELYGQATSELSSQASTQQSKAASTLQTFGADLSKLGRGESVDSGLATELVQNLSQRASGVATWLEQREPADVLQEVKQFAARRPGLFIALAATAGIVGARLTKALVADAKSEAGTDVVDSGHLGTSGAGTAFPNGTTRGVDYGTGYTPGAYVGDDPFVEPTTPGYGTAPGYGETGDLGTTGGVR
ncbi:hypothetical protein GCM10025783_20870 [Amnibacterium soli]|uniref:ATP synthase F0 subunit B n=1 Tax=Amnibacterium soli TaxID=1282736 RepID=A0ABP8Z7N9_9MICO